MGISDSGKRFVKVVGLSSAVGMAGACSDVTAPAPVEPSTMEVVAPVANENAARSMASLAGSLDDMTVWWMGSLEEGSQRGQFERMLAGLKGHLVSGKTQACLEDINEARGFLAKLSDKQQAETGALGVALDVIQATLEGR